MADRRDARLELVTAGVLALASALSAWAAFQASLWGGIQATAYARASTVQTEATELDLEAGRERTEWLTLLNAWLDAAAGGDARRMMFYERHLPDRVRPRFEAWRATLPADLARYQPSAGDPPLALPEIAPPGAAEAARVRARAEALLREGEAANSTGDRFGLVGVVLALTLFLAGISQPMRRFGVRAAMVGVAAALMIGAAVFMVMLPQAAF